ncbi:hypothetical protein NitYY0826_C1215 [Nitratiruptor sp. YY08-26]|uniref:HAMP domain-containing sensor histidine kinase n=1 Tax=unclassified Nitratiruptor TaxID=2624044 RepID=UPI0019160F62|nr:MULTISPECIES: ATP-binding protein [unclassified Nitratiruptor]BCD62339.1 hypothetical protein NitYY0813_C1213 [Nitratiruptor sp. YY08-13]BCD66275.1 hypothetical protein NitYY0826_C1215 [Nitratiruptor sp. YY08-26]
MLRLHQIFFSHLLALLGVLFILVSLFSYYGICQIEIDNFTNELKTILKILDEKIDVKKIDKKVHARVTLIDSSGKVLAESRFDPQGMENHLYRPEIKEAMKKGWGRSVRYSATLHQDFLYVAKRLGNGKFLRLAKPLQEINEHFLALWIRFMAIFALFIFIALLVSFFLSKKIKAEVQKILDYVDALWHKEYEKSLKVSFAKEFELLSKHLQKLAKRLQKREAKKERYTQKIKQISRQRTELISAISHEFKNPVAVIDGYAQTLLEEEVPQKLQKRFIEKIYNASQKISYMIDRLALAMKFESGSLQPHKERFDMCEALQKVVEFIHQRYKNREIQIACKPFMVYADRQMIETVLFNLLDNALKYSELAVVVRIKDDYLEVIDRGIGIKEKEIKKLTKKFYRVRQSWDNSMGLGLYITEYILQLHHTKLEIVSEYGKGSVFRFSLKPLQ